jgi:hypothetical protein
MKTKDKKPKGELSNKSHKGDPKFDKAMEEVTMGHTSHGPTYVKPKVKRKGA